MYDVYIISVNLGIVLQNKVWKGGGPKTKIGFFGRGKKLWHWYSVCHLDFWQKIFQFREVILACRKTHVLCYEYLWALLICWMCCSTKQHNSTRQSTEPSTACSTKLTLILRRSRTGTVWFYTSTSNKRAAPPKLYTKSLTRDLKRMYNRLTLVRISINL